MVEKGEKRFTLNYWSRTVEQNMRNVAIARRLYNAYGRTFKNNLKG